jgi:hypothetical protein
VNKSESVLAKRFTVSGQIVARCKNFLSKKNLSGYRKEFLYITGAQGIHKTSFGCSLSGQKDKETSWMSYE